MMDRLTERAKDVKPRDARERRIVPVEAGRGHFIHAVTIPEMSCKQFIGGRRVMLGIALQHCPIGEQGRGHLLRAEMCDVRHTGGLHVLAIKRLFDRREFRAAQVEEAQELLTVAHNKALGRCTAEAQAAEHDCQQQDTAHGGLLSASMWNQRRNAVREWALAASFRRSTVHMPRALPVPSKHAQTRAKAGRSEG